MHWLQLYFGWLCLQHIITDAIITRSNVNGTETLSIDEPSGKDYYCTSDATSCNITVTGNCNSLMCIDSGYHCPTNLNCQICDFECADTRICQNATLYSHSCKNVRAWSDGAYTDVMRGMRLIGPYQGNLNIYINSGQNGFQQGSIISNETNNIDINVNKRSGDNVATRMYIDGSDIVESLSMTCNADCYESSIICPQNINAYCTIDCRNAVGNFECRNLDVYTRYGFGNLNWQCLGSDSSQCSNSELYCFDEKRDFTIDNSQFSCTMAYSASAWNCNAINCVNSTDAPTNLPSITPTHDPTIPTAMPVTTTHTPTTNPIVNTQNNIETTSQNTDDNNNNNDNTSSGNTGNTDTVTTSLIPNNDVDISDQNSNENNNNSSSSDDGGDGGTVVTIVLASIISLILFILLIYLCRHPDKWNWIGDYMIQVCKNQYRKNEERKERRASQAQLNDDSKQETKRKNTLRMHSITHSTDSIGGIWNNNNNNNNEHGRRASANYLDVSIGGTNNNSKGRSATITEVEIKTQNHTLPGSKLKLEKQRSFSYISTTKSEEKSKSKNSKNENSKDNNNDTNHNKINQNNKNDKNRKNSKKNNEKSPKTTSVNNAMYNIHGKNAYNKTIDINTNTHHSSNKGKGKGVNTGKRRNTASKSPKTSPKTKELTNSGKTGAQAGAGGSSDHDTSHDTTQQSQSQPTDASIQYAENDTDDNENENENDGTPIPEISPPPPDLKLENNVSNELTTDTLAKATTVASKKHKKNKKGNIKPTHRKAGTGINNKSKSKDNNNNNESGKDNNDDNNNNNTKTKKKKPKRTKIAGSDISTLRKNYESDGGNSTAKSGNVTDSENNGSRKKKKRNNNNNDKLDKPTSDSLNHVVSKRKNSDKSASPRDRAKSKSKSKSTNKSKNNGSGTDEDSSQSRKSNNNNNKKKKNDGLKKQNSKKQLKLRDNKSDAATRIRSPYKMSNDLEKATTTVTDKKGKKPKLNKSNSNRNSKTTDTDIVYKK